VVYPFLLVVGSCRTSLDFPCNELLGGTLAGSLSLGDDGEVVSSLLVTPPPVEHPLSLPFVRMTDEGPLKNPLKDVPPAPRAHRRRLPRFVALPV